MTAYSYGLYGLGFYGDIFATFTDEVAFASLPFDDPQVYTDLTVRTRLRSWGRGRQSETVQTDTGTSSTTFENMDRALDSENKASVYYPNVLPMRRIRCTVTLGGTTYYLFTNFVDPLQGWQLVQDSPGYAEVVVPANDGFDVLSSAQFSDLDSFPQETTGARINAILDLFDWPAAERNIDTSVEQMDIQAAVAGTLTGQSALDQIQAASDTEDGIFFIDGQGYATFHDRYHHLHAARSNTVQAIFTDAANFTEGAFFYESLTPSTSPIVNDYLVTRLGGTQAESLDSTSIGVYRRRSKTLDTLHLTDAAALDFGTFKLAGTKDPHRRYDEMVVTPGDDGDVWLILFQLEIGDLIQVMWSPPGGGDPESRGMFVEAVRFDVGPGVQAKVTYRLSPAGTRFGWILGDAVWSDLGVSTIPVY